MLIDLLFIKLMPIVILIAIGFYWKKKELPFDKDMISSLLMNLGTPALLIASINNKDLTVDNMLTILIYGTSLIIVCTVLTTVYLKIEGKEVRPFLQSFIFPNTGGLGIPIVYVLLGETAFVYAITFSILINILCMSIMIEFKVSKKYFKDDVIIKENINKIKEHLNNVFLEPM